MYVFFAQIVKNREKYWMQLFIDKLINTTPKLVFEMVVLETMTDHIARIADIAASDVNITKSEEEEEADDDVGFSGGSGGSGDLDNLPAPSSSGSVAASTRNYPMKESSVTMFPSTNIPIDSGVCAEDLYIVSVLELGSNSRYIVYAPRDRFGLLHSGSILGGNLYNMKKPLNGYLLLPEVMKFDDLPENLREVIVP